MNLDSHVTELRSKHLVLSKQIEDEQRRPASNALEVTDLKRRKLYLKEEIARITSDY